MPGIMMSSSTMSYSLSSIRRSAVGPSSAMVVSNPRRVRRRASMARFASRSSTTRTRGFVSLFITLLLQAEWAWRHQDISA